MSRVFDFSEAPVLSRFLHSNSKVRVVKGPVGSGKTTACVLELKMRAERQQVAADGYRYFRAAVVRNTGPELHRTTMRTLHELYPPDAPYTKMRWSPPVCQTIDIPPSKDTPGLKVEFDFFAMDDERGRRSLLSYEGTMIYFNEAREFDKGTFDRAVERVGRYPKAHMGRPSFAGVIADTNPPDDDHWMPKLEEEMSDGVEFFHQPPAVLECAERNVNDKPVWVCTETGYTDLFTDNPERVIRAAGTWWMVNPHAENINNVGLVTGADPLGKSGYYLANCIGKDRDDIRIYLQGYYGATHDGKAVIPEFNPDLQIKEINPIDSLPVYGGMDVGAGTLNPACVLAQRSPRGNWLIFDEICPPDEGVGLNEFVKEIRFRFEMMFPKCKFERGWGDPAGEVRDGVYETTAYEFLQQAGLRFMAAPTNDVRQRIHAIKQPVMRLTDGKPGLIIHPRCKNLIKGLKGGWQFRRVRMGGAEARYKDMPDKSKYSHICDALGYLLLGAGEGRPVRQDGGNGPRTPASYEHSFSVL